MTITRAIALADELCPNAYSNDVKLQWINQIEGRLALEVFLMAVAEVQDNFQYTAVDDTELLVKSPHDDIYTWWLRSQIDLAHAEYDKAANDTAMFEAAWNEFVTWFCQRYDPAQGYRYGWGVL